MPAARSTWASSPPAAEHHRVAALESHDPQARAGLLEQDAMDLVLVGDGLAVGAGVRALAALIHVHVGAAVHEQRRVDEVVGDDDIGAGQAVAPGEGQQLRIPGTRTHDRDEAAHGRRV
jgi:hypothetical protein